MASALGVPGLTKTADGRYRLIFRYRCPVDRVQKQITRLYPASWPSKMVAEDAKQRTRDAVNGEHARREAETPAQRKTIAEIAPDVIRARSADDVSPASLHEFNSIVIGADAAAVKRGRKKGGGRIVKLLGHLAPSELTSEVLATFLGTLRGEGLSPETIRNTFKVLGVFVRICRVLRLDPELRGNPIRDAREIGLRLPTKRREAPIHLTLAQAGALLSCADVPETRRVRYAVALLSGLRDGEIAGLTWADVDLSEGLVSVSKALAHRGGVRPTKTVAGERKVPIHHVLAGSLRLWRSKALARLEGPEDAREKALAVLPLFMGKGGRAHRPASAKMLRTDLARAGVTDAAEGLTFHALRRSFATWLDAAGVSHEVIERLMGHEPRSVLGRHYAAGNLDVLREAIGRIKLGTARGLRSVA